MARRRKAKKPQEGKPPPVCKAILLCDAILNDPFTGKSSIVGIFEKFIVPKFPGHTSIFFGYVQMTNGIGQYRITVEIRGIEDDQTVARADVAEMVFPDRAAKLTLIIPIPPLPIPKAGMYDFIVLADGQEIDRQQFIAITAPEKPNAESSSEVKDGE